MKKWLSTTGLVVLVTALVAAGCGARTAPTQSREELPKTLSLGTMPAGTSVNAQGTGIADIVSKHTPMEVKVVPATSEEVWVPKLVTNEIQLGVAVSLPMRHAYLGAGVYKALAEKSGVKGFPVRVVAGGSPMRMNFLVRGDSGITKVAELKGKRVVSFPEQSAFDLYTKALLANGGLTVDDVVKVPAANPVEGTRAVMEGRADATMVAVDAPVVVEAVGKIKARFIPLDRSPEAVARIKKVIDTAYVDVTPGGVFVAVPEPQPLMQIDTSFVAHKGLSESAVYEITKAIWENNSELVKKPGLSEWVTDRFLLTTVGVPYHPGAVKFYKQKGVWNQQMEQFQAKVLSEAP